MEFVEARLIEWYPLASEFWSALHPRGLLSGAKPGAVRTELSKSAESLYIRKDNGSPDTVVNVFDTEGGKAYTIERTSRNSTLWTVYDAKTRAQVAILRCGLFTRTVVFLNKHGIHTRQIGQPRYLYGGLPGRRFYLNSGAPYEWTQTQVLEKIINPGGGHEEVRERVARVRLLRSGRFDWELLIDPAFDRDIALATAFVSLLTRWSTNETVVPGSRA